MRQYPKIKKIHLYQKANTILLRETLQQNPEKRSVGMQIKYVVHVPTLYYDLLMFKEK